MKTHQDAIQRAQQFAASILPEPELLAPQTPAQFVAYVEAEAAQIGETLSDLTDAELEFVGGLDAWRALVVRAVTELVDAIPESRGEYPDDSHDHSQGRASCEECGERDDDDLRELDRKASS